MNSSAVLNLFEDCGALLRGHFVLSNGQHSDRYLECALALQDPARAAELGQNLAELFKQEDIDKVVAPAMGGLIIGYEVARCFEVPFVFAERGKDGVYRLKRGFTLMAGERVLLVDDVITGDDTLNELYGLVAGLGGLPVGATALADRSGGRVQLPVPVRPMVELDAITFPAKDCPQCREGVPIHAWDGTQKKPSGA